MRAFPGVLVLSTAFWSAAVAALSPQQVPAVPPEAVSREILRLSDDSYPVREEASRQLWALGREAVPALREALKSGDPEVVKRAKDLLRKADLALTPDTPPEVLALIKRYGETTSSNKQQAFRELNKYEAWRQMLSLYALEQDGETRELLHEDVKEVVNRAVRKSLVEGKTAEAREYLEMAPADRTGLVSLAEFHRSQGSLNGLLAKAAAAPPAWRLAMYRAAGDTGHAREAAVAAGDPEVGAVCALLEGDPLPWFDAASASEGPQAVRRVYVDLAKRRWTKGTLSAQELEPLLLLARSEDETSQWLVGQALFLLGEVTEGERMLEKMPRLQVFRHYDLLERVPEALKAIGLDPEKPDFKGWAEERFKDISKEPDDSDEAKKQLRTLAAFLENRGLDAEQAEAFDKPLAAMAADHPAVFTEFLKALFNSEDGLLTPKLGRRVAAAYAGQDEGKWRTVVAAAFGEGDDAKDWWNWLIAIEPSLNRAETLDAMLALFRRGTDPGNLREEWLKKIWEHLPKLPPQESDAKLQLLGQLAVTAEDLTTGLRVWDRRAGENDEGRLNGGRLAFLSAAGRWERAATLWLDLVEKNPSRAEFHAYAAASLRRAGKAKEAEVQDAWADKLALGEAVTCVYVGQGYASAGDFQRADLWWERALRVGNPGEDGWSAALILLASDRMGAGDWKRAAAFYEALALTQVGYRSIEDVPLSKLRLRANIDLARAIERLPSQREKSLETLDRIQGWLVADGLLADDFFPAVRGAGLVKEHDAWFEKSWKMLQQSLQAYPKCVNTCNSAAWLASRAMRRLDEAESLVRRALDQAPDQSAYLDTYAEIWFARGNRKLAIEWSDRSIASDPLDPMLRRQRERYRSGNLPR